MRWGGGSWVDLLDSFIVVFIAFPSRVKNYGFDASSRPPTLNISYNTCIVGKILETIIKEQICRHLN